ncbi:MAG: hypothetical protein ACD_22C00172G0011 [uncultured bacterium]|uniref:Capsule synthesis protein CapA domain-containing protein n=1 Tax=candidate division WWE3 bacterium RBG_16_37_10 TaxID=1802610 RepID=A0A1F4V1T0_UNCKA|nr:MAG: hypothetical protein ACD_22C00172G0011 [uncultured bacterium]OGC51030.1 MAG: hypothetical protein A2W32_01705 [candidate division WWE3 bacterium RBG_16_37_10]
MRNIAILLILLTVLSLVLLRVFNPSAFYNLLNLRYSYTYTSPTNTSGESIINKITGSKSQVVLIATGDVIPARSVNAQAIRNNDFNWAFKYVNDLLSSADITLINLESPLIANCPVTDEGMIFCGDERNILGLTKSGVDIANLTNNHLGNYGEQGITATKKLLSLNNIMYSGTGGAVYKTVNGTTFAFLGYNDIGYTPAGLSTANEDLIKDEVSAADKLSDVVIVSFHWGNEYTSEPNQRQKDLAHLAIDNGADLIIGNHPHWVQSGETYKDKYIKYAHGNFIFDQMWSEETKKGVIGKYTFEEENLKIVEYIPVYIQDYGQVKVVEENN